MNIKNYFLIITLIGMIFLVGGAGATINRTMATAACEACGMEIQKEDVSSFLLVSSDGSQHWACCPICGMVEAIYYSDSELQGQCFSCGKPIVMNFRDGELSYLDFSGNSEFIRVVLGGSCMTNKLTCSPACSNAIRLAYDWASNVPEKTLQESANIANTKLSSFTIAYRPTKIPLLNYALIGIGISLISVALIALIIQKRKTNNKTPW
jgi:hypothetical protein